MTEFNFEKVYGTNAQVIFQGGGTFVATSSELIANINLMRRIYKRCKFICKVFA